MKKSDLKKTPLPKRISYEWLVVSLKKALRIIGNESKSTSNLQVSTEGLSHTFLTYDELRKINAQLLKLERQKAEAIQFLRNRYSCI